MAVQELGEVSGKHLLPGFGEEEDDHEETIASTVQEITGLFKECERRLKEIHNAANDGSGDEVCCRGEGTPRKRGGLGLCQTLASPAANTHTSLQQAVRKNIEQRVAKQLQDLSIEFRRGHKNYLASAPFARKSSRPPVPLGGAPWVCPHAAQNSRGRRSRSSSPTSR